MYNIKEIYFLITDFIDHVKTGTEAQADADIIAPANTIYKIIAGANNRTGQKNPGRTSRKPRS